LQINALIPHIYIEDENIRILFNRKLFDAQDIQAMESVRTELIDRFGKIPDETEMLFKVIDLKLYAEKVNIERIAEDRDYIYIYILQRTDFSDANIIKFIADYSIIIEFIAGKYYAFRLKKNMIDADIVEYLKQFLLRLRFYMFK
jgi:transcription-repair coupling factor (superfamily II helicase)